MWIHIRNLVRFILTVAVIYAVLIVLGSYCFIVNAAFLVLAFILADIFIKFIWRSLPSSTLSDLKDRAVLITGCDRGFGNELARQLDGKGVTVFAGCLFAEGTGAQELKKNCSKKLHVVQLDVTKEDQVKAAVETIKDTLKGKLLFSIVNNAGILTLAETEYLCTEEQKKVLEVNTFGVSNVTQAFLPMLRESKGRVVIVASSASTTALPFMVAYNMSKFAVFAYAETLRREMMRWGISVHTIEPWIYGTDIVNLEQNVLKLKTEFNRAPKDIQKKYGGEEYIKSFENIYGFGLAISQPRGKIHEVTNCLADAAIGKHPELRYTPGLKGKFLTWLTTVFPLEAIDLFFYHLINFYMRTVQKAVPKT